MTETFASMAVLILLGLTIFQVALILGAPIGRFSWGGQHNVLPTNLRIASASSIALYVLFSLIILAKAGMVELPVSAGFINISMWMLTGYFSLGIIMNALSRSKPERMVMTPVAAILAVLFLYVAFNN